MLRKRTRSHQKDQQMGHPTSDSVSDSQIHSDVQKHKTHSFFNVPGLFVGFNPKGSEFESVRSPTSPLDLRVFSNLGNPFRSPKSLREGHHQKSWDCNKVGLSIVDSLDDDSKPSEIILQSSDVKNNVLFGPQMRIKRPNIQTRVDCFESSNSLPKNYAVFPSTQIKPSNLQKEGSSDVMLGIGEALLEPEPFKRIMSCSLDSGRSGSLLISLLNQNANSISGNLMSENGMNSNCSTHHHQSIGGSQAFGNVSGSKLNSIPISIGSGNALFGSLSASEIELSEDYTCVKIHGPNPKTTHIFGDCILECHNSELTNFCKKEEEEEIKLPLVEEVKFSQLPPNDFLSFCYYCKKELDGEDIYMYRGEKAFCSWDCRSEEILIEEAMENTANESSEDSSNELFETCMFIAT